jgi:hypothetical protein
MNQLKIEVGDTVESRFGINKGARGVCEYISIMSTEYRVSWDDYNESWFNKNDLTLIKKGKTMQFTKSDLKTGMFVKQRNGDFKIVLGKATFSYDYFMELLSYSDELTNRNNQKEFDIMSVYKKSSNVALSYYLKGQDLTPIWERTEQTEAQKEMEVLQEQAKALQEQITKLQGKL